MKKMILLVLCASLNASASTAKLLEYVQGGGFFANFSSRVLTVDVNGKVVIEKKSINDKGEVTELAQLSKSALENLKKQVTALNPSAVLVDANQGAPQCMDAPYTRMTATQGTKEIVIYTWEACHESNLTDREGHNLVQVLEGLNSLAGY